MRRVFISLIIIACVAVVILGMRTITEINQISDRADLRVVLAYNSKSVEQYGYVLDAYSSVLLEEGVPFERLELNMLLSLNPVELPEHVPAIIFPDGACQSMVNAFEPWLERYTEAGGSVFLAFDAGTRTYSGDFRNNPLTMRLAGVDYLNYDELRDDAFGLAHIRFRGELGRDRCQIPLGKVDEEQYMVGYGYGRLMYNAISSKLTPFSQGIEVLADSVFDNGRSCPAVTLNRFGKGLAMWVNLPLGYVKAYGDDLPLRAMLRTFLFDEVHIPHLLSVPDGIGGLVINWHVDSNIEWDYMPILFEKGYLRPNMEYSIHITAGDFLDEPGDAQGFEADGGGLEFVRELAKHGAIGSHGGWGHNWFAFSIDRGVFGEKEIEENINRNSLCLENIVNYPIVEYSAPVGVHPQPLATQILERNNYVGYYYTGDTGSAPNRSFYDGKMVSERVLAFPVMPMGTSASLEEFGIKDDASESQVRQWLEQTAQFTMSNRCIRLIYSHPYNLFETYNGHLYGPEFVSFFSEVEGLIDEGRIQVKSITTFARFLLRFYKTDYSFNIADRGMEVRLNNPEGLEQITVAIPRGQYARPVGDGLRILEDQQYYYAVIEDQGNEKVLNLNRL
ncbi:MAG: hypothetical protein P9M14_15400 [Candidatus Alcyoniella australis]|nr:hypothetical protein [Candidatus Alcyoniella australis]